MTGTRPEHARPSLVGRGAELHTIDNMLGAVLGGSFHTIVIAGEPGIGKSTLASEAGRRAVDRGLRVAWGRCRDAEAAPPYWMWTQVLRSCSDLLADSFDDMGPFELDLLARILPEWGDQDPSPLHGDPHDERTRFELQHVLGTALQKIAAIAPLMVLLEDVHDADAASMELLARMPPGLEGTGVGLTVTCRPEELDTGGGGALASVASFGEHVTLGPLDDSAIRSLVASVAPTDIDPDMLALILRYSGGNPLFAREITRLLAAERRLDGPPARGQRLALPSEVREVIRMRTAPLPEAVAEVVATAAVIGEEFDFALLQEVTGFTSEMLLDHVGTAVAEGVIDEVPGAPGRYRFHHALLRTVIYDELRAPARAELHRRAADAIESLYARDLDMRRSELAHHLYEATPLVGSRRIVDAAVAAGDRASHLLTFDEADDHYRRALTVLLGSGDAEDGREAELLLRAGVAQRRAGSRETRATLKRAFALARRLDDSERMARAALAMQVGVATIGTEAKVDGELAAHLEGALEALGDDHADLRARALSTLAETYYWGEPMERAQPLAAEALARAEQLGDDAVLARALVAAHYASWNPDNTDERWGLANRILDHARRARSPELSFMAHSARITVMLERADMASVDTELAEVERLYGQLGQPVVHWALERWRATRALADGRLDAAQRHANLAVARASDMQYPDPIFEYWGIQVWGVHVAAGTTAEMADALRGGAEDRPAPGYRASRAALDAETGNAAAARVELSRFFVPGLNVPRRDMAWMVTVASLARALALVGDLDQCSTLMEAAAPLAHRCVVVGDGTLWSGPLAQWVAPVAQRAGQPEAAERLFELALDVNRRAGALPFLALTMRDYAVFLKQRGDPGDARRRERLLEEAREIANRCGLSGVAASLDDARAPSGDGRRGMAAVDHKAHLRREGDRWIVGFEGRTTTLNDLRGLRYLAALVADPGRELHVLDLSAPRERSAAPADRREAPGLQRSVGPMLDETAKQAYAERVEELREQIAEAESFNDSERAARAREEVDAITEQLAAAVGLGGRDREAGSDTERARVAVRKAVRSAMQRIADHSPDLAAHLEASVQTGVFCSYRPDPAVEVSWVL